jgi:hypothetical protein
LRYRKAVSDFTLALEFKMKANCNSGVCFRAESYKSHLNFFGGRPSQTGYEIQLLDDHKREAHPKGSGALYRYRAPRENAMKPADHWNSLSLECRGSRLKVKMNGIVIHDFDQNEEASVADKPLSGFLSLQNHGGEILFRNIELEVHEPKHDVAPAP